MAGHDPAAGRARGRRPRWGSHPRREEAGHLLLAGAELCRVIGRPRIIGFADDGGTRGAPRRRSVGVRRLTGLKEREVRDVLVILAVAGDERVAVLQRDRRGDQVEGPRADKKRLPSRARSWRNQAQRWASASEKRMTGTPARKRAKLARARSGSELRASAGRPPWR
jgi:hypothetical protein